MSELRFKPVSVATSPFVCLGCRPLITVYRPALVKCLLHEHVVDISCGSSHTAVRTRLDYSLKEGVEKARDPNADAQRLILLVALTACAVCSGPQVHGGRMYVCGAAAILKILTPVFKVSECTDNRVAIASTSKAMPNKPQHRFAQPVTALKDEYIKQISCGNMMIAAITLKV